MKQEIAQLKVEKRLSDVQWTGKEQNYKKTIQQLQGKVSPPLKQCTNMIEIQDISE